MVPRLVVSGLQQENGLGSQLVTVPLLDRVWETLRSGREERPMPERSVIHHLRRDITLMEPKALRASA